MVLLGGVIALHAVARVTALLYVSFCLREDDKTAVPFPSGKHEQVVVALALIWVTLNM